MLTFAWNFSVAFIAATLIVSGAGHVAGFRRFVTTVQSHGLVPIRLSFCVAALVTVLEVAGGGIAFAALGFTGASPIGETYFVGCAAMGLAYLFYVRRLLRRRDTVASCGCSPLASAVTPASLVPSAGLLATSCVGLAVSVLGTPALMRVGEMAVYSLLAVCWGVTLAGIVLVYPAVVPAAVREGGR